MTKFRSRAALVGAAAAFSVSALAQVSYAGDPVMYEPFDYPVNDLLLGKVNPSTGKTWVDPGSPAQTGTDTQKMLAGNTTIANLPAPVGNKFSLPNLPNGNINRIVLPDPNGYTYDTATSTGNAPSGLFMSMAVTVLQDTNNNTLNYFAGFHLGPDPIDPTKNGMSTSNGYAGMIFLRQDPNNATNYNFGVSKNNATGTQIGWSPQSIAPGETVFLTFQYKFNTAAANNDDTVNLWINPDLTGPMPTTPSATTSTGFDGYATAGDPPNQVTTSIVRSAFFRSNGTGVNPYGATPSNLAIDEMRIGLSYADVAPAATVYWDTNADASGSGGTAPTGNWDGSAANFNNNSTGGAGLFIASPASDQIVSFAAGSDATGNYSVTVSGTQKAASVKVAQGHVSLSGGTISTKGFNIADGAIGTVTSAITSPTGLIEKSGAGTLQVTKLPQSTAMHITAGKVQVLDSSPTFPNHPSGDDSAVSQPSGLGIAEGATLDLGNNDVIIRYGAGTPYNGTSPVALLEALVAQGFGANQDWTGTGITSSTAASEDAAGNFVIAIADNALLPQAFGVSNGGENFDGVDVPLEAVLIKFTHRVDLNLDGLVNGDDAQIFSTNYDNGSPAYWSVGDLDYNGVFNSDDVQLFATYYDNTLQHLPEPATLSAVVIAGLALARRRRA